MLTPRMKELLEFLEERISQDGVSPTHQEMANHLKLKSKAGVNRMLACLTERGFIERRPPKGRRAYRVLRSSAWRSTPEPAGIHARLDRIEEALLALSGSLVDGPTQAAMRRILREDPPSEDPASPPPGQPPATSKKDRSP